MTRMQKWLVLFNIRVSENVSSTYSSILEFNLHKQTVYIMLLCVYIMLSSQSIYQPKICDSYLLSLKNKSS